MIERIVGVVLILSGSVATFLGVPPVSWAGFAFFFGGLALIGTGIRELRIASRIRRSGS